jgi:hypothetical protein
MTRFPLAAAVAGALAAALLLGAPRATPARQAATPLDGPAYWAAGGPDRDHAARAYPQYAQQQSQTPLRFMSVVTLQQRLRSGDRPLIIDVRTRDEWLANRLPGSVNINHAEIDKHLEEIPRQGTVVLY